MEYNLIKSNRKTLAMEIGLDGVITVKAPIKCTKRDIDLFVANHSLWAERALEKVRQRKLIAEKYAIPPEETEEYIRKAWDFIPDRVWYWSKIMNLQPTAVKITKAQKRYGSCNSKNSLCFSYQLMAFSRREIDYVIVHELAHIVYKNHSKQFYGLIEKYLPDYRESVNILKLQGE